MKTSTMAGGRTCVHVPNHPAANNRGYILRSRYTMEQKLGRLLRSDEHVHHKDNNELNDDDDNLEVMKIGEHTRHHHVMGDIGSSVSVGESHYKAKLTVKAVRYIRKNCEKHSQRKLAQMFGVGRRTIRNVLNGSGWKHVL